MKRIFTLGLILLLFGCCFADEVAAEKNQFKPKIKFGMHLQGNYLINDGGILGHGFGQFLDIKLAQKFYISMSWAYTELYDNIPGSGSSTFYNHEDLQSHVNLYGISGKYFFSESKNFNPYLNIGGSIFTFSQSNGFNGTFSDASFIAGLGAEIPITDKINIYASTNANISHSDAFTFEGDVAPYLDFNLGCSFSFAAPKPKLVTPEPVVKMPEDQKQRIQMLEDQVAALEKRLAEKPEPQPEPEPEPEYEDLMYMVKPYDYLLKLSYKFYNDSSKWEDIYEWNKDKLAQKGPNLIYPFEEIKLKNLKKGTIDELDYNFYEYEVRSGQSLWSIAKQEYDNPLAWIVIVNDNQELLERNDHQVNPGMILKLRTKLFNEE